MADPEKSPRKSRKLTGVAADPALRGRGPAKGAPNAGRPPDEWRKALRALADRPSVIAHVESVLEEGPTHPFFAKALDYATEHGYGKAASTVDVTSGGERLSGVVILPPTE